jgi:hypothetical protein
MGRLSLALVLVLLVGACSDETDVSGLWTMPESASMVLFEQFDAPYSGKVKLAIDQFGWDVAGVVLFYRDEIYYDLGSCHYLVEGEVRGNLLLFSLHLADGARLLGNLAYRDEGGEKLLVGRLSDPDGIKPDLPLTLVRVGGDGSVHEEEWDHGCP